MSESKAKTTGITLEQVESIQKQLWQENEQGKIPTVYAILGGARDKQIEKIIRLGTLKSACLIDGKLSYEMAVVAPYMVRLEKDHKQTIEILQKGWGNSWGVFAITYPPATLINIRQNCKKLAKVTLPDNKTAFFRYYDPRVLRPYLPTCTAEEAKQIFGHISEFVVEGEEAETVHRFKRSEEGVVDVNTSDELFAEIAEETKVKLTPDDEKIINTLKTQLGENFIRQSIGLLKLKALAYTDPNNELALKNLLNVSLLLSHRYDFFYNTPDNLADIAHTFDLWRDGYPTEDWAQSIFQRRNELSLNEKIIELFREKAFQLAGPESMDYRTYCILRFKDRNIDPNYSNQEIFIAAKIGLDIAQQYNINDLNNTYMCTEMVLIYGDHFLKDAQCEPIKNIFEDETLTAFNKTYKSYEWLAQAMQHRFTYEYMA